MSNEQPLEKDPASPASPGVKQECRVKFWGVRGSIPTPGPGTVYYGGNTSCIEVRADGEIIIMDAGTGIARSGWRWWRSSRSSRSISRC